MIADGHIFRDIASVVGVLWLSWLTLRVLKALAGDFCAFFLAPLGISRIILKKYGSWAGTYADSAVNISSFVISQFHIHTCSYMHSIYAVITGASEGIGQGYALEVNIE